MYLMHLPWGWVKQRPHFIAEGLSRYFEVSLFTEKQYLYKSRLVRHDTDPDLQIVELFKFPHIDLDVFLRINTSIIRYQLKKVIGQYDFIWLTHPNLFRRVKDILPGSVRVVYDCMDDFLEFPYAKSNPAFERQTWENEKGLVERCDLIFASSDYLKQKISDRYAPGQEVMVMNNAICIEERPGAGTTSLPSGIERLFNIPGKKLVYIGAIADWFDTGLILESLGVFKDITYILFGPCEIKLPEHERLRYGGPVEHRHVYSIMAGADALIMPFKTNELVLSVNPVKLYEYIYGCRPAISVEYGETLKFNDYIYLYRTRDDYFTLVRRIVDEGLPLKRTCEENRRFADRNTWDKRVKLMADELA